MDPLDAYHRALELVKKAGFELANASMQSETCYYTHSQRQPLLLRIFDAQLQALADGLARENRRQRGNIAPRPRLCERGHVYLSCREPGRHRHRPVFPQRAEGIELSRQERDMAAQS